MVKTVPSEKRYHLAVTINGHVLKEDGLTYREACLAAAAYGDQIRADISVVIEVMVKKADTSRVNFR